MSELNRDEAAASVQGCQSPFSVSERERTGSEQNCFASEQKCSEPEQQSGWAFLSVPEARLAAVQGFGGSRALQYVPEALREQVEKASEQMRQSGRTARASNPTEVYLREPS
jgi:hypothetical protein